MTEITEILYQWLQGNSQRKISALTGTSRNTISKIIKKATKLGLGPNSIGDDDLLLSISGQIKSCLPDTKLIQTGSTEQRLATHHEQIKTWYFEPHMTVRQIGRLLREAQPDLNVSETSLHRYIKKHFPKPVNSTCVLHSLPGEQAQVDFGYAGKMFDPETRKHRRAHAFVMTLSYSRMRFVHFVFKQDIASWIDCHIKAFEFFGGVPQTVLLDNLKSGVIKADFYDPTLNRTYAECARYYGFVADPAKVRTPTHKGKVERSIQIVRQQVLAGRNFNSIHDANRYAQQWCKETIANVVTRTTGETPSVRFDRDERAKLMALPERPYELALWQAVKVGRDQHITYQGSFYSVPEMYVGYEVLIKATQNMLYIYRNEQQVKVHKRASRKGSWHTDTSDISASAKCFLENTAQACLIKGKAIGEKTHYMLSELLSKPGQTNLRKAQAILRLEEKYSSERLENACSHALSFGNTSVDSLKRILNLEIDLKPIPSQQAMTLDELSEGAFLRDPKEFVIH